MCTMTSYIAAYLNLTNYIWMCLEASTQKYTQVSQVPILSKIFCASKWPS